jgi:hypothetical protein
MLFVRLTGGFGGITNIAPFPAIDAIELPYALIAIT